MTEKELIQFGYKPKQCKIGTLYFKGSIFVRLNDNIADVREVVDDTNSFGTATTLDELKDIENKIYDDLIQKVENKINQYRIMIQYYEKLKHKL